MTALFHNIHPGEGNRWIEERSQNTRWNARRQRSSWNQREGINRPDRVVIVIIGALKPQPPVLDPRRRNVVEMRMHRRRMIVIGPWMNVLKRRYKKCQHEGEASL